jgi:hypothetical protein
MHFDERIMQLEKVADAAEAVVRFSFGNSDYEHRKEFRNIRNDLIDNQYKALRSASYLKDKENG